MHLDDVLTELVEHSGDRLLRVAYQLTHDAAAAQDLVQEALLRVYQSVRHRGLAPEDWCAYLRRAVINEYVRTRRLRGSTEIVTDVVPERRRVQRRVHQLRHYRPRREQGVRLRPVARPDAGVVQPVLPGHRPARPGRGDGSRGFDVRDHLRTQGPHGYHQLSGPGIGSQPAADPPLDPRLFRYARPFRGLRDFLLVP
jgi:hypothetical protein